MRVISLLMGAAAVHVSPDDVAPDRTLVVRELIEQIKDRYGFSVAPAHQPAGAQQPIMVFQDGALVQKEARIPIYQLFLFGDGGAIVARHTDEANAVLDDLIAFLGDAFGFRYQSTTLERLNTSNIVVDLDPSFTWSTPSFSIMRNLIHKTMGDNFKYHLKRITFGVDSSVNPPSITSVKQFIGCDFIIEARANSPIDSNRFFSSAPLPTNDHIYYLEKLEKSAIERNWELGRSA